MEHKTEFKVLGLDYSKTSHGAYLLLLSEVNGNRKLPIIIGSAEAQSIAVILEKMKPQRPFTHDIFKSVLDAFSIALREIHIYNLVDGIFYAKLICNGGQQEVELDSRSSDAIAMAIRFDAPIFVYDFIAEKAAMTPGDLSEEQVIDEPPKKVDELAQLSKEELANRLELALSEENYELASKIRDELNTRS
ncbi:MAG TPA: hypothetical protein DDX92_13975 [Flavobacteriales bacterium]|jgi:bifunctional DNase/RNase|nr:hypothetical protein [Flavobacteriales bacterium]